MVKRWGMLFLMTLHNVLLPCVFPCRSRCRLKRTTNTNKKIFYHCAILAAICSLCFLFIASVVFVSHDSNSIFSLSSVCSKCADDCVSLFFGFISQFLLWLESVKSKFTQFVSFSECSNSAIDRRHAVRGCHACKKQLKCFVTWMNV